MRRPSPAPTLFPYTTLFRSDRGDKERPREEYQRDGFHEAPLKGGPGCVVVILHENYNDARGEKFHRRYDACGEKARRPGILEVTPTYFRTPAALRCSPTQTT